MNYSNVIQGAVAVLIVVAALAAVIAYLRTNISKGTIDLYRLDNDALRARVDTLEDEVARARTEVTALKTTVITLRDVVTQKESIDKILRLTVRIAQKEGVPSD